TRRRLAALVAHRFPDGHCSIQIHTFEQMHDGSSFSGALRFEGSAGNIQTGCSMIEWMRAQGGGGGGASAGGGGASGGGASGGGGCSNTCSSANDGECDDGGPGAEYAVCGLGTDCADCGAR
ncbi:MAG: hypothetical protein OEY14_18040, partial [Myxococcales bacterium]|nr:hypothetical protein [Myxococcales bacterium]